MSTRSWMAAVGLLLAACGQNGSDTPAAGADGCDIGKTQCGDLCVSLLDDSAHCGTCSMQCASGTACAGGTCTACPDGQCDSGTGGTSSGTGGVTSGAGGAVNGTGASAGNTGGSSSGTGGVASSTGGASSGTGGSSPGSCDPGTTTTTWASGCATSGENCMAGTWVADGPDPDHQNFTQCSESEHFVVYSDETCSSNSQSAVEHLETVWSLYFGSPMYMREPLCDSSTKYKASVHVHSDWGLTGGAWDSQHMGMWIGTGGLADHWGLAHEFMHGVQAVEGGQRCNGSNTCGWVHESHANWAAQQQTEYHDSDVHCSEMLANMPHLMLGSTRDRYCNWQFMEYLKDKYCFSAVNAIWTGSAAVDPFTAIRNGMGWDVGQLNDFMGEWAMHNVTWDYQDPDPQSTAGGNQGSLFRSKYGITTDTSQTIRQLRTTKVEPLDADYANNRRFISPHYWAPQRYGYNIIRLYPESGASEVTITFRGVTSSPSNPDWRWGLVATDSGIATPRYSGLQSGSDGALTFCVNADEEIFLVVVGTPSAWYDLVWDQPYNTVPRYPYMFELAGAWPEGFRDGTQDDCPSGLSRASNGGGCAPSGTTAYVGPYATVLSGATVSGSARIEDHAIVANGTVSGGTVGALTLIGTSGGFGSNPFNMSSGTAKTTFYPLGFFESGQGLSGATLIGDVEYRGNGLSLGSGTCSGFVDNSTCIDPGSDATPAPPYTWR